MKPKLRKVNIKKRKKERKEASARLAEQTAKMMQHPKECCACKTTFERTKETVKTWHVMVHEERVRLTCPNCWGIIKEALENNK